MLKLAQNHSIIIPMAITLLTAFFYMSGVPFALWEKKIADNNIFFIANMVFAAAFCIVMIKGLYPDWSLGITLDGLGTGLVRWGWPLLLGSAILLVCNSIKYHPLTESPAKGTILIWVVGYYFFVAVVEEVFLRGVFLQTLIKGFAFPHGIIAAVLVSSIVFGLGHIPGMLQQNISIIVMQVLATFALGVFFSCIYLCSGNLLSIILLHWMVNIAAAIFFYYSAQTSAYLSITATLIISLSLAVWGMVRLIQNMDALQIPS